MHEGERTTAVYCDLNEVSGLELDVDWMLRMIPGDGPRLIGRAYGDAALLAAWQPQLEAAQLTPVVADGQLQAVLDVVADLQQMPQIREIVLVGATAAWRPLALQLRRQGRLVTAIGNDWDAHWSARSVVTGRRKQPDEPVAERLPPPMAAAGEEAGQALERLELVLADEIWRAMAETEQGHVAAEQVSAAARERLTQLQRELTAYRQMLYGQLADRQQQTADEQAGIAVLEQWASTVRTAAPAAAAERWLTEARERIAAGTTEWAVIVRRMIRADGSLLTLERMLGELDVPVKEPDVSDAEDAVAAPAVTEPAAMSERVSAVEQVLDDRLAQLDQMLDTRLAGLEQATAERTAQLERALDARLAGLERATAERTAQLEQASAERMAQLESGIARAVDQIAAREQVLNEQLAASESMLVERTTAVKQVFEERLDQLEQSLDGAIRAARVYEMLVRRIQQQVGTAERTLDDYLSELERPAEEAQPVQPTPLPESAASMVPPVEPPAVVAEPAVVPPTEPLPVVEPVPPVISAAPPAEPATPAELENLAKHFNGGSAAKPKQVARQVILPASRTPLSWPAPPKSSLPKTPAGEFEQLAADCADHALAVRHWVLRERGAVLDPTNEGYLHDDALLAFCGWRAGHYQVLDEEREFWRRAAGSCEAAAAAARGMSVVLEKLPNNKAYLENGLKLVAEAQSALRALTMERTQEYFATQLLLFKAVRELAKQRKIHIERHLRQEDLAAPTEWKERLRRMRNWAAEVEDVAERPTLLRRFIKLLEQAKTASSVDWQELDEIASRLKQPVLSDRHRRELQQVLRKQAGLVRGNLRRNRHLAHLIRLLQLNLNAGEELDARETAAGMSYGDDTTRIADDDAQFSAVELVDAAEDFDEYTQAARDLLRGQVIVLIGGESRPEAEEKLRSVFEPRELIWVHTVGTSKFEIEHLIARDDVRAVFLAIRWVSHAVAGKTAAWCRKHNRPLVRLTTGYNVGTVAHRLMTQVSGRISEGSEAVAD